MSINAKSQPGLKIFVIIALLLGLAAAGLATWRLYTLRQSQQQTNQNENPNLYSYTSGDISFEQPKEWSSKTTGSDDEETITLEAPGTRKTQLAKGYKVEKGAIITIATTPCTDPAACNIDALYTGDYASATKRTPVMVDGAPAVRFALTLEGEQAYYTVVFKNNKKYVFTLTAEDNELTSRYLAQYILVTSSFRA